MEVLNFIVTIILVTASGALAPGPLFFATVSHGAKSGAKSGLLFSVSHTLVEFTLVILLALGLLTIASEQTVKLVIGVLGGIVLIAFGTLQIRDSLTSKFKENKPSRANSRNLLLIGLAFTGLNPFFIIWWLTVGAQLIIISLEFASFAGVVFMYLCHVWMDYVWLIAVAHFAKMGTDVVGFKWYKIILVLFGGVLIYFGLNFIISSIG